MPKSSLDRSFIPLRSLANGEVFYISTYSLVVKSNSKHHRTRHMHCKANLFYQLNLSTTYGHFCKVTVLRLICMVCRSVLGFAFVCCCCVLL